MQLSDAQRYGRLYGVTVTELEALSAGSVNSNFRVETTERGRLFMRVYEEQGQSGAEAELQLVTALGALGVPTPRPLRQSSGQWVGEHQGKPVGLYEWLPGEILRQRDITADHAWAVGAAIARVHQATDKLPPLSEGRFGADGIRARLERIASESSAFDADIARIRQRLAAAESGSPAELPSGLIHGDLYRDNVLWQSGQLSALLDFESASRGAFIYDVMVCLHFWCFGDGYDLELCRAMLGGYQGIRPLTAAERGAYRDQAALGALRFATTRITDFSLRAPAGQAPIRDYRRLLQRMDAVDAGVLDPLLAAP